MSLFELANCIDGLSPFWEEFKVVNDRKLKEIKQTGSVSFPTKDYVDRLNDHINSCKQRISHIENAKRDSVLVLKLGMSIRG